MSRTSIARWIETGRLHRVYRGVYAYGHPHLSRQGQYMAAVLAADGVLAGWNAAFYWRAAKSEPRVIDVLVRKPRRAQPGYRVRVCRNLDPRDVTVRFGIPVTTFARVCVDLTDDMEAHELANVIHEAAYLGLFDADETRAAMERANGRRNLGVLKEALRLHESGSAGTRSGLERRVRRLVRGAGLPAPRVNTIVNGFEVDFYWPGLCVEIDGATAHGRRQSQVDDRIRDAALRAAGFVVLRFREEDLDERPGWLLAQITAQELPSRVAG